MKILSLLLLLVTLAFSKVYYAKVEPYEMRDILSNVSGKVVFADENMLGKLLSQEPFVKVDTSINKEELLSVTKKLEYLQKNLQADKEILLNLENLLKRKRENFQKIESLSIKSKVEKDGEFYALVGSENSYLGILKGINSLKMSMSDLEVQKKRIEKSIADKNITAKGFVLYSLKVAVGNVVSFGTPIATVADVSRSIVTIYLDVNDVVGVTKKRVYIDEKETPYRVTRVIKIADVNNLSRYRAQIIMKRVDLFSKVVKIELKEGRDEEKK